MILSVLKLCLSQVVSGDSVELEDRVTRLINLCDLFLDRYGDGPINLLRAPARINLLGEHIDYVSYLPTASLTFGSRERDALMLYRECSEPRVQSASTSTSYSPSFFSIIEGFAPQFHADTQSDWLSLLHARPMREPHWQNYVEGAVRFAQVKFGKLIEKGFDFAVDSTIPPGGGASSSSALVVLGGAAIREVNGISFTPKELAKDSAMAEWYIGTRGGSMDHITICLAQNSSALLINYSTQETKRVSLPDMPFQWITFFSKPADKGRDVMGEYNERAAVSRLVIPAIIDDWKVTHEDRHRAWCVAIESFATGSLEALDTIEHLLTNLPETIALDVLRANHAKTFGELGHSFPTLLLEPERWPLPVRSSGTSPSR